MVLNNKHIKPSVKVALGFVAYCLLAATIAIIMYTLQVHSSAWTSLDADRFHQMALMIINGSEPYVTYIDPKPPLLFFTIALMDILSPAGSIDILFMTILNVVCAMLIWKIGWEDYGCLAGYSAGLLFLIVSVFTEGYFLFSEQFTVLFLLLSLIMARQEAYASAGVFLGLACGFKQYAFLGLIPLLYLMWAHNDRRYHRLLLPVIFIVGGMFAALYLAYGMEVGNNSVYYTFLIAPLYNSGNVTTFSTYVPETPMAYAANFIFSITVVIPTLLFALASAVNKGFRTHHEKALGIMILVLFFTLLVRQYLHYWILLMPFLALLACREFADSDQKT
ncbi:MAG: hypothetical protein M0Q91_00605 [Methanoregula sp.]|jgi:hypothetical protein|nr:hypothetical protein [Methanoregula sp.]